MNIGTALVIVIVIGFLVLGEYTFSGGINTALMAGTVTGVILGHPDIGLKVGAACQLMSLGFFPYGGAVTPSYPKGAIFGVVVAVMSGDYEQGIVIGSIVALLSSWFVIAKGFINVRLIHLQDKAVENKNVKAVERIHLLGMLVTVLVTNVIPIFLGLLIIDRYEIIMNFVNNYAWVKAGLSTISKLLPAVGFALLLSYMDIKGYWPFMIMGYIMYAYFGASTMCIALTAIAVGYIYVFKLKKNDEE